MNSVSVVVVIVGVVIAAITAASLSDGPKPPTPRRTPERTGPARPGPDQFVPAFPGDTATTSHAQPSTISTATESPTVRHPPAADPAGRPRRIRAIGLLVASVIALGTVTAGLIGGTVLLGVRLLDRALG